MDASRGASISLTTEPNELIFGEDIENPDISLCAHIRRSYLYLLPRNETKCEVTSLRIHLNLALNVPHRITEKFKSFVEDLIRVPSHPNMLETIRLLEEEDPRVYITEWMDITLDRVIYNTSKDQVLPDYSFLQAIEIVKQICNGLMHLTDNGWYSLKNINITPKRVFVSSDLSTVKVSGFESLKLVFTEEGWLTTHWEDEIEWTGEYLEAIQAHKQQTIEEEKRELLECLRYTPPETIYNASNKDDDITMLITPKMEIYSLAITMCELLTRQQPYGVLDYAKAYDLYAQIIQTSYRPDCDLLDDDVRVLIERGWRTAEIERPSMRSFYKDLDILMKDHVKREEKKEREDGEMKAESAMVHPPTGEEESVRVASGTEGTTKRRSYALTFRGEQRFLKREIISKRHLGVGVEGVIYVGEHAVFGKVAVKRLLDNNIKELRMTLQLRPHPNIVIIYGLLFEEEAETIPSGYVMEAMHTSLNKVIHKKPDDHSLPEYSTEEAVEIMQKICRGVHFLHQQAIFHRDLKPENVLTSNDLKTIKLCDFGMSTTLNSTLNMGKGTIIYMAPEVMIGEEDIAWRYNAKCDVYSAAICFWELLHKQIPFGEKACCGEIILGVTRNGMRPSIDYSPVKESVKELLRRAWHADADQRPSISEMTTEIARCT